MKEHKYSVKICNLIKEFLSVDDWHYSFDDRRGTFQFGLNLTSKIKNIKYLVDVDEDSYIIYAYCPIGADADDVDMMHRMSDFICRANYGLKNGNFEFDMRDGEIRYKCYTNCEKIVPSVEVIRASIYCPAIMFERYGTGIVEIIFNNATSQNAIIKSESKIEKNRGDGAILASNVEAEAVLEKLAAHFSENDTLNNSDVSD